MIMRIMMISIIGDYAAGGSWGSDKCGGAFVYAVLYCSISGFYSCLCCVDTVLCCFTGGPINNNRTSSIIGGE